MDIFSILLPIVYIIVGAALVWFVIELAITSSQGPHYGDGHEEAAGSHP